MSRWGETFAALSGGSDTLDTIRHSGDPLSIEPQSVNSVTAPTPSVPSIPPAVDRALAIWGEAEAERAVIVGDEGAISFDSPGTSVSPGSVLTMLSGEKAPVPRLAHVTSRLADTAGHARGWRVA